jgi:2-hydroxy-3-oxopropionate reductase
MLEGLKEGTLIVDMSTISPVITRELAQKIEERGASMLDAPVSGGEPGAQQGSLAIMVGGSEEDFERAKPLLEVMGDAITHVGPAGAGQTAKAANQIVVAVTLEGISEALVLASKAGVAPEKILEAISGGLAGSNVMEAKKEKFIAHDFEPGFRVELHHKDLGIALAAGREYGVSLPVTAIVDQMLESLKTKGRGDRDHSAILTLVEDEAQHEIGNGG